MVGDLTSDTVAKTVTSPPALIVIPCGSNPIGIEQVSVTLGIPSILCVFEIACEYRRCRCVDNDAWRAALDFDNDDQTDIGFKHLQFTCSNDHDEPDYDTGNMKARSIPPEQSG